MTTSAVASTTATTTLPTLTPPAGVDTGTSASVAVPPLSVGGTAYASMAASLPSGSPTLSSVARSTQSVRSAQSEDAPVLGLLFFGFSVSTPTAATVTLNYPSFTIGLPSSYFVAGTSYYMALYDPTHPSAGYQDRAETCTAAPTALTLSCTGTGSLTVASNVTYYFALYAVSSAAPSPTPAPTGSAVAVPTNSPTPAPTASASAKPTASPTATASATAAPTATPTATPVPVPVPSASISSMGGTITFPTVGGVAGSVTYGSAGGGGVAYGTAQVNPGNGFAPTGGSPTTFYSVLFQLTGSSSLFGDASSTASFTIPNAPTTGSTYYLATYNGGIGTGGTWVYAQYTGTATSSGGITTVSFPAGTFPATSLNLSSGYTYGFALYSTTP